MLKGGYWGKILWVDLTDGKTSVETFDDAYARKYLSGVGLATKIISDKVTKHTNPLGPGNVLVFAVGLYQATDIAGSGRCSAEHIELGGTIPELGITAPSDRFNNNNKGFIGAICQDVAQINNSLDVCGGGSLTNITKILNYITGWDVTPQEVGQIGERIVCMQHLFNIKMGLIPEVENVMPERLTKPHKGGGAAGQVPDWRRILKEYWQAKGWNEHGIPTEAKVKELGLQDFAITLV